MTAATTTPPTKMTIEEWGALAEDESGEWVDGAIAEEEMASLIHEVVAGWLIALFRAWARPRGAIVAGSDLKLRVRANRGRKADVVVFFRRGKAEPRGLVTVPPDLIVEIVSPDPKDQRRDRIDKLKEYAAFGVGYYWLVSPELRSVEILELGPDRRYTHVHDLTEGKTVITGCEGLELDLDDLWAEVARVEQVEE